MTRFSKTLFCAIAVISLSGCIDRGQADTMIANGCVAAGKAFMPEGSEVKQVKGSSFKDSREFGSGYRAVIVDVVISDGWYDADKQFQCVFAEEFGVFNSSYSSTIYQLNADGTIIGSKGGKIHGTLEDQTKMTAAADGGMNE